MKINEHIEKRINELIDKFIKDRNMDASDVAAELRKEAEGIPNFFGFLLEKLLYNAFSKGYVILSPGLLKFYLESWYAHKSHDDKIDVGYIDPDITCDGMEPIVIGSDEFPYLINGKEINITPGIFIKILLKLELNRTLDAYIRYRLGNNSYSEIRDFCIKEGIILRKDIEKYDRDIFMEIMYQEFREKVDTNKRYIKFNLERKNEKKKAKD